MKEHCQEKIVWCIVLKFLKIDVGAVVAIASVYLPDNKSPHHFYTMCVRARSYCESRITRERFKFVAVDFFYGAIWRLFRRYIRCYPPRKTKTKTRERKKKETKNENKNGQNWSDKLLRWFCSKRIKFNAKKLRTPHEWRRTEMSKQWAT